MLRFVITIKELKKIVKDQIYIVFFDFKSAFDMVNWNKLFERLVEYGFGVDIIKTIKILFQNIHLTCGGLNNAVKLEKGVP